MTISSTSRKAGPYIGNGLATQFSFAFKVFSSIDVVAVKTDSLNVESFLVNGDDFNVLLNSNQDTNPGGTITLTSPLANGFTLTITSSVLPVQPVDFTNQGGFYPKVLNTALDRLTILIQQLYEEMNGTPGAGTVQPPAGTFTQSGAGAVTRDAQAKMREWVSVKDFGAVGNGIIDDTAAITAAITSRSTNGGCIYFPSGTYKVTSQINIAGTYIHLLGDYGASIKRFGAFSIFKITGSYNRVEDLHLDGNKASYPYPTYSRSAVLWIQGDFNTVEGCLIDNSNSHGVLFSTAGAPDSNLVDGNIILNCDEVGIAHDGGTDNRIVSNHIAGCKYEAITLDQASYRCVVDGNRINANCSAGGVGSIGVDGTDLCVISNNVITGTGSGLSGITFQNNLGGSNLNIIDGNVLDSNGGYGIELKTGTGGSCSNNTITGNILRSNNTLGSIKIGSGCQANVLRGNHYGVLPDIDPASYNQMEPGLVFFYAKNTVTRTDVTGDNTTYQIPFDTVAQNRNIGSSFNTATGVFTAPITGLYQLSAGVRTSTGALQDFLVMQIVTTGGTFANGVDYTDKGAQECSVSGTIFMRRGETAYATVRVGGDTKVVDVTNEGNHNFFTGTLVG